MVLKMILDSYGKNFIKCKKKYKKKYYTKDVIFEKTRENNKGKQKRIKKELLGSEILTRITSKRTNSLKICYFLLFILLLHKYALLFLKS